MNRLLAGLGFGLALGAASSMAGNGDRQAPGISQLMGVHTQGVNYQLGRGVRQDLSEAARWYLRSARLGYADSQNDLAKLYEDGRGVPRDEARAYFWYSLAIEHGNSCAALDREKLSARMSAGGLAEGQALVQTWRSGNPVEAMSRLK